VAAFENKVGLAYTNSFVDGSVPFCAESALGPLMQGLGELFHRPVSPKGAPEPVSSGQDVTSRQQRQIAEIDRDTQFLLAESPYVRAKFMQKLTDCKNVEEYKKVVEKYSES